MYNLLDIYNFITTGKKHYRVEGSSFTTVTKNRELKLLLSQNTNVKYRESEVTYDIYVDRKNLIKFLNIVKDLENSKIVMYDLLIKEDFDKWV